MMKLDFEDISIENFKSFRGSHRLDLLDFGEGLHFVRGSNMEQPRLGSNGSGKSSLFDALCWCLYGQTPDGLHNPDVRPWTGETPTEVGAYIKIDDEYNTLHEVIRSTSPNRLLFDGEVINQEQLNAKLRLALPVFTHTILMGQGQPLFFDLTPRAKMDLFSDVLALDRWETRSDAAALATEQADKDIEYALGQLDGAKAQLTELESLLKEGKKNAKVWADERAQVLKDATTKLSTAEETLAATEYNKLAEERAADSAGTELKALKQKAIGLEEKRAKYSQDFNKLSLELRLEQMKVQSLQKELSSLANAATCPTCGQPIKRNDLQKHRAELQRQIDAIDTTDLAHDVAQLEAAVMEVDGDQNNAIFAQRAFQEKLDAAEDKLDYLRPQCAELKAEMQVLREAIQERRDEHNPLQTQVRDLERRCDALVEKQETLKQTAAKLERHRERTKFWVKGFKDVRLHLIEETLEELTLASNAMLPEVGLEGWAIQYAIERENKSGKMTRGLSVMIHSPNNKEPVRWEAWSGGESQRLRLVGALALGEVLLAQAGVEPNLEILDEPTHHLSGEGIRDLCEYLALRGLRLNKTILFVDHHAIESRAFTSVLSVIKDEDGSWLKVGG